MKAASGIGRTKHLPAGKRRSFTLIELLVVIAIIAILAGLVMPALNKARASAVSASCVSNLRQLGMVMMRYSDGNQGFIPPTYSIYEGKEMSWADLCIVRNYLAKPREGNEVIFRCPKLGLQYSGDYSESYGGDAAVKGKYVSKTNVVSLRLTSLNSRASEYPLFADSIKCKPGDKTNCAPQSMELKQTYRIDVDWGGAVAARHQQRANLVMGDGHVQSSTAEELKTRYKKGAHQPPIASWWYDSGTYFQYVYTEK